MVEFGSGRKSKLKYLQLCKGLRCVASLGQAQGSRSDAWIMHRRLLRETVVYDEAATLVRLDMPAFRGIHRTCACVSDSARNCRRIKSRSKVVIARMKSRK